ncbi:acetyl-CoA carboxylase biotin carboxylase subunit [Nguyenibacter sp. L1]|uniref:acetyl-CoA carboxylase biotin carboxylase subunit n=1 Tax=Nguyenibacter sp. L1 TaxID=3049350 RepID=UPI002B4A6D53|nr:acetyl-CoA carboxylase biotin carboxylase subunit [Nguyenibacter sp. L1]WRH89774.1 acetyl-CoA carboxylase biotin carboxylase subunit [Nguyenibacter sp. L1]
MIKNVLIANRGEIALRVIRACHELGLRATAIYSTADRDAAHVAQADDAICIGPASAARSYLNKEAILQAAHITGADAVHPGYGFLSENAAFARMVVERGLVFVGPPADVIDTMGDKLAAKRAMIESGVPCVPGTEDALPDDPEAIRSLAEQVGYPVLIKAAAGGGGRGMRVVEKPEDLIEAASLTRTEAGQAFANPDIYIEKFMATPRHVEIQVLCDNYGNAIWLGERDCSMQRRHQKVLEEAPAPFIARHLIAEVAERAVAACKLIGYRGVGTFEFLYQDGHFYFIEMNTRLQVEHPVTELVTGVDLVQAQLRVAQGETLWLRQSDVDLRGVAIECRLNAEDPVTFAASPGTVTTWCPAGGPGIRVDSHMRAGDAVSPYYDSMIGKLIAYAPTRDEAIRRMLRAVRETRVEGVSTNLTLHEQILLNDGFVSGTFDIHAIGKSIKVEPDV